MWKLSVIMKCNNSVIRQILASSISEYQTIFFCEFFLPPARTAKRVGEFRAFAFAGAKQSKHHIVLILLRYVFRNPTFGIRLKCPSTLFAEKSRRRCERVHFTFQKLIYIIRTSRCAKVYLKINNSYLLWVHLFVPIQPDDRLVV